MLGAGAMVGGTEGGLVRGGSESALKAHDQPQGCSKCASEVCSLHFESHGSNNRMLWKLPLQMEDLWGGFCPYKKKTPEGSIGSEIWCL